MDKFATCFESGAYYGWDSRVEVYKWASYNATEPMSQPTTRRPDHCGASRHCRGCIKIQSCTYPLASQTRLFMKAEELESRVKTHGCIYNTCIKCDHLNRNPICTKISAVKQRRLDGMTLKEAVRPDAKLSSMYPLHTYPSTTHHPETLPAFYMCIVDGSGASTMRHSSQLRAMK